MRRGAVISDAEVAEVWLHLRSPASPPDQQIAGRLIVRRVRRLNPVNVLASQGELFASLPATMRLFTDSPPSMLDAEINYRVHAIIEQVHADLRPGALAQIPLDLLLPTASDECWRRWHSTSPAAAATLALLFRAKATTAARLAHSTRYLVLHLPKHWPWQTADWETLFRRHLRSSRHHPPGHQRRRA